MRTDDAAMMRGVVRARYDEVAEWYDARVDGNEHPDDCPVCHELRALDSGVGGLVIDLGCGTGAHRGAIRRDGREVVGVDLSEKMASIANRRLSCTVVADAVRPPLRRGSADLVISAFVHTDVPSPLDLLTAICDLLRPGGTALVVGAHPCFNNPFFGRAATGDHVIHPGYRDAGFYEAGPGLGDGIRSKVGVHHVPLAEYLTAVARSGLTVEEWREDERDPPFTLSFRARRLAPAPP